MTTQVISELIAANAEFAHFTGGVSQDRIRQLEERWGNTLPETYRWFLREYGHGGIWSFDLLGVGPPDTSVPVAEETERFRRDRFRLPPNLIIIGVEKEAEWIDEFFTCLDLAAATAEDCPVVYWHRGHAKTDLLAEGFSSICTRG